MKFKSKIISSKSNLTNEKNYKWWNNNPMLYDWDNNIDKKKLDLHYFKQIDDIFGYGHSLCNNPEWPKSKILKNFIPYSKFKNKKVLEIGCGAGLVAQDIAKSEAILTAIDITEKAIELTKKRFSLNNLSADIIKMDAEKLKLKDNSIDFVVSWGVVHHSGSMQKIINEIHRVLKKNGEAYIMVYNKNSLRYRFYCVFWLGIFKLYFFKYLTLNKIAGAITDGYIARHLNRTDANIFFKKFKSLKLSYSDEINTISLYLLGPLNRFLFILPKNFKNSFEKFLAKRFGWYMQIVVKK